MQRPKLITEEIYHIYNRGVEKRNVFLDDRDRFRFIHDLFEFNDSNPALNLGHRLKSNSIEVGLQYIGDKEREPRKLMVEILAFCLMPNHFHLMVRQKADKGITEFMRKLGTGYTNYFNQKYERVGSLFQGKFKAKLIEKEAHFIHLPYYIHLNPLDLAVPEWRDKEIRNKQKVFNFLENYRWSSYLDYIGKKNFPSVTQREFLMKFFNGPEAYKRRMKEWITMIDIDELKDVIIE